MLNRFEQLSDTDLLKMSKYLNENTMNLLKGIGIDMLELFVPNFKAIFREYPKIRSVQHLERDITNRLHTLEKKILELKDILLDCYFVMWKRIARNSEEITMKNIPDWAKPILLTRQVNIAYRIGKED